MFNTNHPNWAKESKMREAMSTSTNILYTLDDDFEFITKRPYMAAVLANHRNAKIVSEIDLGDEEDIDMCIRSHNIYPYFP